MSLMWGIVSPFMNSVTKNKIVWPGKKVTESMSSFIDISQLETSYGGELEEGPLGVEHDRMEARRLAKN